MQKTDNQKKTDNPLISKLFIGLVLAIFAAETTVMLAFHFFLETLRLSPLVEGLADSLVLVISLIPVLYFLFYRPLSSQIARHKQDLAAIQGLKTGYGVIIRTAMDGFWLIDIKGRILEVNDSYCRLTGYSRQELLAMSVFDLRAQEKPEDTKRHIQRIIESGGELFESKHRCKDGRIVDLDVSVNYLDVEGGRLFAFLRDITGHKKTQRELEEANAVNSSLIQAIPFGIDIVDEEGNILYLNPRLESVFGKEAIGKKCWELYRDDKQQCDDCPLRGGIVSGETAAIETSRVFGGRSFQISHTGMIYQGKKAILEVFQDITERKNTAAMLERLGTAVRQTADIVTITDRDGKIEYVNPAFEAQTGYKAEEAVGNTPRLLKSGQQGRDFYEGLWKTILSGEVFRGVLVNRTKAGRLYYSEKTITPIKDKQGNITGFVSTEKDITARKTLEEELTRTNKELWELDRLKKEFLNMASHELRTPIAIVKEGVTQLSEGMAGAIDPKQKRLSEISLRNISRLVRVVDNIFEVSEIEFEKPAPKKEWIDIAELAKSALTDFLPLAKDKGLEIKENFPPAKVMLSAEKTGIIKVWSNLISNAVKSTERGHIEIKIVENPDTVECSVSDTGTGVAPENLPKVFDKFQQFNRGFGPGERGTGLGLAIAKGIVELHKGKIGAESRLGEGSRFTFVLPKN